MESSTEPTVEAQNEAEIKANYPGAEPPRAFPVAVLTPEQWGQVERACVAGMTYAEASKVFQVTQEAIRQRAFREEWLTPIKIEKMRREQAVTRVSQEGAVSQNRAETALEALSTTLEGYRSRTVTGLARLAEKGISRAVSADLPIENWQDAKIVADIAMKLHQIGNDGVQVNVCAAFAGMEEGPLVETEAETEEDETESDGKAGADKPTYFLDDE